MTLFRRLSVVAAAVTLIQVASGGIVRATGSGDGCPDWPRCFGRWLPPLEYHALIEWTHRLIGQLVIWSILAVVVAAWRIRGRDPVAWRLSLAALGGVAAQALLGMVIVWSKGPDGTLAQMGPGFVTVHIAVAVGLAGLLVHLAVRTHDARGATPPAVRRLAMWAAAGVSGVILLGAYVRARGAGLAFPDWPLMDGTVLPGSAADEVVHFLHRAGALGAGWLVVRLAMRARREASPWVARVAGLAAALFVMQVVVGALQVWTRLEAAPVAAHVALSALVFAALVAAATAATSAEGEPVAERAPAAEIRAPVGSALAVARAFLQLTKPRIILLLLITTVPTMILAAGSLPPLALVAATLVGGTLAAGAANAINCVLDRDIDAIMRRTRSRPLPAHQISPSAALTFAVALAAVSFWLMTAAVNLLSALLTQAAIAFYVFVYTLGLKRSTPQNIVVGGAAGAVPVLVGWAAVTGTLSAQAWILFGVIFLWTPAHFWALAMRYEKDYAAAGVPMMPVVAGREATQRQILLYAALTVAVTLAFHQVAGMGAVYLVAAVALGAWFIRLATVLKRTGTPRAALDLFRYSISYLALLFAAVGVDTVLHIPT